MKRLLLLTLAAFLITSQVSALPALDPALEIEEGWEPIKPVKPALDPALEIEEGWETIKPALPARTVKPWTQNDNVAKTLTTSKDKQKFEALLASAQAILNNQQVVQQKQRFTSNWKALNEQLGRAHWGVSPSAWLEGIAWRDRLVGIYTALEYILGQINATQAYAENEKMQLVSDISELMSKSSRELNK